jgi:LacI family transcriptional regulator
MRKKRVAIGDIARELNISITTVSFILNGKAEEKRISKELTKKVIKLVKEIGYVPNQLAKSLRTGKTNIIGLIVEDISNPFFAHVARLIEENANKRGYRIFYCSSESNTLKTRDLIKLFRERQVDGYIITPAEGIEEDIRFLLRNKSKVVLFDRFLPEVDTNHVVVDNYKGAYEATDHLVQQGYKNIAFVTLDSEQTQMKDRLKAYKDVLLKNGRKTYIKKIKFQEDTEKIIQQICDFLTSKKQLDSVFFATNYLGKSGLEAIRRLQLKIPADIGFISFDDLDLFRWYAPSITVVAQPIADMSEHLINILLEQLDKGEDDSKSRHLVLPPTLIIRESTIRKPSVP